MTHQTPLRIQSDQLRADILAHGASLVGVRFAGQSRNMVLGFADPAEHQRQPIFAGALVGPVANRLRGGRCVIAGRAYQMPRNEAGRHTLHSGPAGLHARQWEATDHSACELTLRTTLSDGDCGLPGQRTIEATYSIHNNVLRLDLHATTDAPSVMSIAAHPYWNLDGRPTIAGHQLQVAAASYLPVDVDNLPTGETALTHKTLFDFTQPRAVPCTPELDVNFCLANRPRPQPELAATLTGACGTRLTVHTTEPGLQVYNGAFLPNAPVAMADAPAMQPYSGIALEPQGWPDAPNHPQFPQVALTPDQPYRQITTFTLTSP